MQVFDCEKTPILGERILIDASAGTGKTRTLVEIVFRMVTREGIPLSKILLVTYTRKAAAELKGRIRGRFESSDFFPAKELYLLQPAVFTIHGFCQHVLKRYPFESRVLFRPEVLEDDTVLRECISDQVRALPASLGSDPEFRSFLTSCKPAEMIDAVYAPASESFFTFPVGRVLPETDELRKGFAVLTEDFKTRGAFYTAWTALCGYSLGEEEWNIIRGNKKMSTYEALLRGLREGTACRTFYETASVLFSKVNKSLLFDLLSALNDRPEDAPDSPFLRCFKDLLRTLRPILGIPSVAEKKVTENFLKLPGCCFLDSRVREALQKAEERKEEQGIFHYNDLIRHVYTLLHEKNSSLLKVLRKDYAAGLIDEFQDTDSCQWAIFNRVFGTSRRHSCILVGDPKQSIYRFRGTEPEIYNEVAQREDFRRYVLKTNYRSAPALVRATNFLFEAVFRDSPSVSFLSSESPEKTNSLPEQNYGSRAPVEFLRIETESDGVDCVRSAVLTRFADEIKRILTAGSAGAAPQDRKIQPSDIAVLLDKNNDCDTMKTALAQRGIPGTLSRSTRMDQTEAYRILRDFLEFLQNPRENMKALLLLPYIDLNPRELSLPEEEYPPELFEEMNLWKRLIDEGQFERAMNRVFVFSRKPALILKPYLSPKRFSFLERDYFRRLLSEEDGEQKILQTKQLIRELARLQKERKKKSEEMPELLKSAGSLPLPPNRSSAGVQIMTVHKSKGLEFPIVFAGSGLSQNRNTARPYAVYRDHEVSVLNWAPHEDRKKIIKELIEEEKKRIFYVACTRAERKLYLPGPSLLKPSVLLRRFYSRIFGEPPKSSKAGIFDEQIRNLCRDAPEQFFWNEGLSPAEEPAAPNRAGIPEIKRNTPEGEGRKPEAPEDFEDHPVFPDPARPKEYPKISSFSSLVHRGQYHGSLLLTKEEKEEEASDDREESDFAEEETLPAGPLFGEAVHALLETLDYRLVYNKTWNDLKGEPEIRELFSSVLLRYFSPQDLRIYEEAVADLIISSLNRHIPSLGCPLAALPPEKRRHEVEFLFPIQKGGGEIIRDYGRFSAEEGFLKGYIDLIFEHDGRFFIADWKSNKAPPGETELSGFSPRSVQALMKKNRYTLQYYLYFLALYKYLKYERKDEFDYDLLGGVYYFFLRGFKNGEGIFFDKPDEKNLLQFAASFSPLSPLSLSPETLKKENPKR